MFGKGHLARTAFVACRTSFRMHEELFAWINLQFFLPGCQAKIPLLNYDQARTQTHPLQALETVTLISDSTLTRFSDRSYSTLFKPLNLPA